MERFALWSFVFMRIIIEGPTTGGLQLHLTLPTLQEGLMLPEKEEYRIELFKDERRGLGITVAGYVCEKGKGREAAAGGRGSESVVHCPSLGFCTGSGHCSCVFVG